MADPLERLQATVDEALTRLAFLEARVAELEKRPAAAASRLDADDLEFRQVLAPALPQGTTALVGRTLLVLAGAVLVRALADGRLLPAKLALAIGLAYAVFWQLRADREAAHGRRGSAAFHDLAGSLIAFPLVWETTARFGLLRPAAAYFLLVAFFSLGLAVAWRRRLVTNAVLTTVLALATAVALLSSTLEIVAGVLALVAMAAGLEWLALRGFWPGLRWAGALVLDAAALLLVALATRPVLPDRYPPFSAPVAAAVLLALPILHMVSVAARALRFGRAITPFDVAQGLAAVLLGFGGASRVLAVHGGSAVGPGAIAFLFGLLCYWTAFGFVERRTGEDRNFYFYSTAGALLTLGGTSLMGLGRGPSFLWAALGFAAAVLGRRFGRMTLRVHSAVFVTAAALEAGLLLACARSLGGQSTEMPALAAWTTALAACGAWIVLAGDPGAPRSGWARLPQLVLAFVAVFVLGKALQLGAWVMLAETLDRDAGAAAVVRTALLALLALGVAWTGRAGTVPELRWLVYPIVAFGGLKLLTQDLRLGRPATLVASLALYGVVLVLAPRLMKPRGKRSV